MITKFGKRFLTSHMAGMVDFTTKDLALGIGNTTVSSEGNDTKLDFDISLAKEKLDWEPKIKLEQGLIETVNYFESLFVK